MSETDKRGRANKYSPLFAPLAREYYRHGYTNAQVGKLFDAAERTVTNWIRVHAEFGKACREGRAEAAEFRVSQIPPPPKLFPQPAPPRLAAAAAHGQPITKVERVFVEPPVRNR
ncbi:MAG TPA: hypothetical protein VK472_02600 [Allosphingosinicella sp.]|nr:hypothetical protein [Allosphingosinicella sp.]